MKNRFVSFITNKLSISGTGKGLSPAVAVAVIAVALSYVVMISAISIVNGFKREIRDKVTGFNSHITLTPDKNETGTIRLSSALSKELLTYPYVTDILPELSVPSVLKTPSDFKGIYLKGIDSDKDLDFIAGTSLESGRRPDYNSKDDRNSLLISSKAASELSLSAGDSVLTYILTDEVRLRKLPIIGIYNTRFENFDNIYGFTSIEFLRDVTGIGPEETTSIRLLTPKLDSVNNFAKDLVYDLQKSSASGKYIPSVSIDTVMSQGGPFFQWLNLLDTNVTVILILMGIVTIVTMISAMLIVITDNVYLIGVLKSLGSGNGLIRRIFIRLSLKIAIYGLIAGNLIALPLLLGQDKFRFLPLDPDSYYIDFVPVQLESLPILLLNCGILMLVWLALLIPSSYIVKISPTETLKYD